MSHAVPQGAPGSWKYLHTKTSSRSNGIFLSSWATATGSGRAAVVGWLRKGRWDLGVFFRWMLVSWLLKVACSNKSEYPKNCHRNTRFMITPHNHWIMLIKPSFNKGLPCTANDLARQVGVTAGATFQAIVSLDQQMQEGVSYQVILLCSWWRQNIWENSLFCWNCIISQPGQKPSMEMEIFKQMKASMAGVL